uniref:Sema domain-containing protein n=1 Tax=Esox lucius TaxID=8010 RepID=A0A6Q2ZBK5_ESOLU
MKSTCLTGVIFWLTTCSTYQTTKHEGINSTLVVSNASVFLLDPSSETLYLGARGSILALHPSNLTWKYPPIQWEVTENDTEACIQKGQKKDDCANYICLLEFLKNGTVYVCGSYAFDPQCAFMDPATFSLMKDGDKVKMVQGKGKCPYNPRQSHTAVTADGVLYTAACYNFMCTEFDIIRATDPPNQPVRIFKSMKLLNDPWFVSSALVKDSHGEDKIYFFFTEIAEEYNPEVRVTRVARVCKRDMGGSKILQNEWTSFLKAQLVCKDQNNVRSYTILSHVYPLEHRVGDPSSTHFYALFTSHSEGERVSAVCVYSLADISKLFATGDFREMPTGSSVPSPRPGQCEYDNQTAWDSLHVPDKVLQFIKEHPLMSQTVDTVPLLVRWGITYTRITAANMSNSDAAVLYLGTDQGELHSISVVGRNVTLLNEIAITNLVEPINNILIHQGHALVGSPSALSRVLVDGCAVYPTCEVCARAQSLGCVWDAKERACVAKSTQSPVQNKSEDPLKACGTGEGRCSPLVKELHV